MRYRQAENSGLIPAHAGKTARSRSRCPRIAAHPRSRGENLEPPPSSGHSGSSPLTRGKQDDRDAVSRREGLIPAHAGKTRLPIRRGHTSRAHPRSRGENLNLSVEGVEIGGSSPLTRGKLESERRGRRNRGLIPAHAGKTSSALSPAPSTGAHPRSRGENTTMGRLAQSAQGSSPLTRGKPKRWRGERPWQRLIPAHAGKTRS